MKLWTRYLVVIVIIVGSLHAVAAGSDDKSEKCAEVLAGESKGNERSQFRVIESPRAKIEAKVYAEYVKELVAPGGLLDQLGIEMTGQVIEFLQPRDLNALTSGTAGGYPVRHYLDGASVLGSLMPRGGGFALEVVYPGPNYQHGFYRDDNPVNQQFSIIDHVVGHNHFALKSGLGHYRYGQGLEATRELDEVLKKAYEVSNKDEVQRFYLWALTLSRLWDWYAPLLDQVSDFEPETNGQALDLLGRSKSSRFRHPKRVTENVLAAFAANLHSSEPSWKRQILEKLITSMSFRPALVHTQIMNEGWASLMQEIIPKHTKDHHNFSYWMDASRVMQTEGVPQLQDPYSLGVACWRRIRERFFAQESISNLKTPIEKDRAFIAHATELISTMTDEEFLRFAIDQTFVDRFKLAVAKKLPQEDWTNLPPPIKPDESWQWRIVSKDVNRVVQMIIDRVLKPKYFYNPRVKLVEFNRPGSGEVEFILDDAAGVAFPLKQNTLGPSLYAMANIIGKPVSLLASLAIGEFNDGWAWNPIWGPMPPWWQEPSAPELIRARIVVAPNGDLKVYRITDKRKNDEVSLLSAEQRILDEEFDSSLTRTLMSHLKAYIDDLYLEDDEELKRIYQGSAELRKLEQLAITQMVESQPYDGLLSQAPNAAGSMLEFKEMLERRLFKSLERAIRQKGGLASGPNGVRVKALPSVVNLSFDAQYIQKMKEGMDSAPVSERNLNRTFAIEQKRESPFNSDESGGVGSIPGEEGDHFWGPGGESEGESGTEAGEGEEDLSWVELPEGLYEKFLGERVKLPILNRKPGDSKTKATRVGGSVRRKQGILLPDEVLNNAMKRGVGVIAGEEGEDPFEDLTDTLEAGFERLQPKDIVVKSKVPDKKPDIKAVVTFVLDASGSTANYMEAFKRFVYDVESLVRASYKGFAFRYIIFDTEAHVLKNKRDFFRAELGGGTLYSAGIKKAQELFEKEYPWASWDRYTFLLGDMDDFSPEQAFNDIKKLLESSDYFGVVAGLHGIGGGWTNEFNERLRSESLENKQLGHTVLDADGGYRIENIREVLKNTD